MYDRLEIETHSRCNRSCWFCPRTYDRSGTYMQKNKSLTDKSMPTDKVLNILDQAQALEFQGGVIFCFHSDPLLDRRNIYFAREARKRGMKPFIHTNGDALKHNESLCQEVIDAYEYIVIGLYDYKTDEELEAAKHYWQNRLPDSNLQFSTIGLSGSLSARSMAIHRALVPTDRRVAFPDLTFTNGPCRRPLLRMIIRYDGEMCNCCEDMHGAFNLGNIYRNSLEELWYSDYHVKIVKDLLEGQRGKYELCSNCPQSPTGPAPDGRKIRIARRSADACSASGK